MPPIKLRCPRCGCRLVVPEHKAGKHGKCPTCGGPIKVPTLEEVQMEPVEQHSSHRAIGIGVAVVCAVLFMGVVLLFRTGGDNSSDPSETSRSGAAVSEAGAPLEDQLRRILGIEARLQSYEELLETEQTLHVRAISEKLHNYEQLTPEELRFRDKMMAVWQEDATSGVELSRFHVPLTEIEKGKHRQVLEDLRQESNKILRAMRLAGASIEMRPDPFGREVLNLDEAREKLADLRTKYQEGSSSPE